MRANLAKILSRQDSSIPHRLEAERGLRPLWLLVPYILPDWIVTNGPDKSHITIRFDVTLSNGRRLSDYPNLYDGVRAVTYGVRHGPLAHTASGHAQAQVASNCITLVRWMVANDIPRFEDLTATDLNDYAALAVYGTEVIGNFEAVLSRHIEQLISKTPLENSETDDLQELAKKAASVLPVRQHNGSYFLDRPKLLEDAGLGGISPSSSLAFIMDELSVQYGLYLSPNQRKRLATPTPARVGVFEVDSATEEAATTAAPLSDAMASGAAIVLVDGMEVSDGSLASTTSGSSQPQHPDFIDDSVVCVGRLQSLLKPFQLLFVHRRFLEDAIKTNLFANESLSKVANTWGKSVGRTASIPVEQARVFLERSIRWVIDYAPALLALHAGLPCIVPPVGSVCSPFPILKASRQDGLVDEVLQAERNRTGMTLLTALNYLMTACAVVIAAFTARRASEIGGLKAGCIERDEMDKPWLRIFIVKTLQAETLIPTGEAVVKAVEVLERLSATARTMNGTPYLFQFSLRDDTKARGIGASSAPTFDLGTYLRKFGYYLDVPATADGTRWTFRPHQFRRFFAIVYIWIYHLGDWGALVYWLRHFDIEMTRRYTTDPELGHILAVADKERTASILANAALGRAAVGGANGERLREAAERIHNRMLQKVAVVSQRKLEQRLMRFVGLGKLTLHAIPWGFCAASGVSSGPRRCAVPDALEPDFSEASIETCQGCVHEFRSDVFRPFLVGSIETHKRLIEAPDTADFLKSASKKHLEILEVHMESLHC